MDRFKLISLLIVFALSACNSAPQVKVTNYTAKGNLESPKPSKCVSINNLSNEQNPVDIFTGLNSCLIQENYPQAAELYFVGMSYGIFDTKRVLDKTAHQAIRVLQMNTFGTQPKEVMDQLQTALEKVSLDNTLICQSLTNLGPPSYKPTYMIQHGMSAFTGQNTKDGLVEGFDSTSAWKDSLATSSKCMFKAD